MAPEASTVLRPNDVSEGGMGRKGLRISTWVIPYKTKQNKTCTYAKLNFVSQYLHSLFQWQRCSLLCHSYGGKCPLWLDMLGCESQ